jgi:hypothetical protein
MSGTDKMKVGSVEFLLPLLIACSSGPFVFKAAGIGNLVALDNPAVMLVVVCYEVGVFMLVKWLVERLRASLVRSSPASKTTDYPPDHE